MIICFLKEKQHTLQNKYHLLLIKSRVCADKRHFLHKGMTRCHPEVGTMSFHHVRNAISASENRKSPYIDSGGRQWKSLKVSKSQLGHLHF